MTWIKRIQDATSRANQCFTEQDVQAVGMWPTCAVGEFMALSSKHSTGLDSHMIRLGVMFMTAVRDNDTQEAAYLYDDIADHAKRMQRSCMI